VERRSWIDPFQACRQSIWWDLWTRYELGREIPVFHLSSKVPKVRYESCGDAKTLLRQPADQHPRGERLNLKP
jgi:hypothetical protein